MKDKHLTVVIYKMDWYPYQVNISNVFLPPADVHCDPGWILYNGQCYYFGASQNSSGYSWDDAQRFCYAANGDLTTISNANEQAFINSKC